MKRHGAFMMSAPETAWTCIAVPALSALPRPVWPRSHSLGPRQVFPLHSHRWHQFVYATAGTLLVTVENTRYVITPEQAIWVPAGVPHRTGALNGADFRNLYIAPGGDLRMPDECAVLSVSLLMRALILELTDISHRAGESADYRDRVDGLILDQLQRLQRLDIHLPWPRSRDLRRICEHLYAAPDDGRTVSDWATEVGASSRTLARRFERELGLSLREWRRRLRLFRAVEWLAEGRGVTDIALALGYGSPSAFTYMFRTEMGCSPTQWAARGLRVG
jgi:AraC-like DNA-binding protein